MPISLRTRLPRVFSILAIGLTMTACGINFGSGTGAIANDPVPVGVIVAQGQFFGSANGQTISGTAIIYFSSGENILRLQGVSFPTESNLELRVIATNSQQVASFILRSPTGNQNYPFTSNSQVKFSQVTLFSNINQTTYSTVTLQQSVGRLDSTSPTVVTSEFLAEARNFLRKNRSIHAVCEDFFAKSDEAFSQKGAVTTVGLN